jgi:nucleotide-binding universal stress UspA family protein
MFEVILVPLDGSELAETALPVAKELKDKFGSRVILVQAVEPSTHRLAQAPGFFESPAAAAAQVELVEQVIDAEREEAKTYLDATADKLGSGVEAYIVEDDPKDAIVSLAKEKGARLIIMSSHGRGGIGRLVFGSVADAVLRSNEIPVLLLRDNDGDGQQS